MMLYSTKGLEEYKVLANQCKDQGNVEFERVGIICNYQLYLRQTDI